MNDTSRKEQHVPKPVMLLRRAIHFATHDFWEIEETGLPRFKRWAWRTARILHLVVKGFREDQLPVHAASLTYASLMSLVPLLAIAFALLRGFGVGESELQRLTEWTATMPEEFQGFVDHLMDMVQRTSFATLGWMGLAVLLVTAVAVLGRIEASVNLVWGIARQRNPVRRAANYISILVVVPILIGLAGTATATLRSERVIQQLGALAGSYRMLLGLSPVLIAWLAFSFLYTFLPNTRVRIGPALLSGLLGALLWLGWQRLYINLQIGVARYNAIYGTFASIPIFLFWLYISWVIVLLGAEIGFAVQHHATYHLERRALDASPWARLRLAMRLLAAAAEEQWSHGKPFRLEPFARQQGIPLRLLNDLVKQCIEQGWIAEAAEQQGVYLWVQRPDTLHQAEVARRLLQAGADPESGTTSPLDQDIERGLIASFGDKTIVDLIPTAGEARPQEREG